MAWFSPRTYISETLLRSLVNIIITYFDEFKKNKNCKYMFQGLSIYRIFDKISLTMNYNLLKI